MKTPIIPKVKPITKYPQPEVKSTSLYGAPENNSPCIAEFMYKITKNIPNKKKIQPTKLCPFLLTSLHQEMRGRAKLKGFPFILKMLPAKKDKQKSKYLKSENNYKKLKRGQKCLLMVLGQTLDKNWNEDVNVRLDYYLSFIVMGIVIIIFLILLYLTR